MIKRVFEGFVNGQKFDNVEDYNEAIEKALEAGGTLEAHTSTHIETVEDAPVDFHNVGGRDFLPDVDLDTFSSDESVDSFNTHIADLLNNLKAICSMSNEELTTFLNRIDILKKKNLERDQITNRAIKIVENNLDEYKRKLDTLYRSYNVIGELSRYYDNAVDRVKNTIKDRELAHCHGCNCGKRDSQTDKVHQLLREIGLI